MKRAPVGYFVAALLCEGCQHGREQAIVPEPTGVVAAVHRDNAALRRRIVALEDRIVRLERLTQAGGSVTPTLPVVRLQPGVHDASPSAQTELSAAARPPEANQPATKSRSLGLVPHSSGDASLWAQDLSEDGATEADELAVAEATPELSQAPSKTYRLVGSHLVERSQQSRAPVVPDKPARDTKGQGILHEYETAMTLYRAGELASAQRAFELFAQAHPDHDYADNALYWQGEAAYDQGQFEIALQAFTAVIERYGGGNKAPDALLKIGLSYAKLGDDANARDVLTELMAAYPRARASQLAREHLGQGRG